MKFKSDKLTMVVLITVALLLLLVIIVNKDRKTTCSDFSSQYKAQKTYESNTLRYRDLDRDKDGLACESL